MSQFKLRSNVAVAILVSSLYACTGGGAETVPTSPNVDSNPPVVTFSNLVSGQSVDGQMTVSVSATDDTGIASIELLDNDVSVGIDRTAPYEFQWTPVVGAHTVVARAIDSSPQSNSANASVNVSRESSPPAVGWRESDFAVVIDVGPGEATTELDDVPWESMAAGTLVKIHWRAEPYRSKFAINSTGTEASPIVILGVANAGRKPVIDGANASTRSQLSYSNEQRSVIKIGGADFPAGQTAAWVFIDNLIVRGGNADNTFTDSSGSASTYAPNAAAIHVSVGNNLYVQNCEITDSGNGIFSGFQSSNVVIRGNYIYGNGRDGSGQQHNTYTESLNIIYEFNHMGPLRAGANGENLKDRSAGTVIRYNWIEGGGRQLDLVDSDNDNIYNDAAYAATIVYGNVLIEPDGAGNRNIVHYGGDLSGRETTYRKGTLHFFHNTVVSQRSGRVILFGPSSTDEVIDARNNIFYSAGGGSEVAVTSGSGMIELRNNWLPGGWIESDGTLSGVVSAFGNVEGVSPGFTNLAMQEYDLLETAVPVNAGGALAAATANYPVEFQYVKHQQSEDRAVVGAPDIGAFESSGSVTELTLLTTFLPGGVVGDFYTTTLSATGGIAPYAWSIGSGALPENVVLAGSTGEISGTPGVAGDYNLSIVVDDSSGRRAFVDLTLTVDAVAPPPPTGLLSRYSAKSSLVALSYVNSDLSGVTYVPDTNTLFLIQNSGGKIWEVDTSFNLIRTISISGFGDSEDLVYLGNNEFAIVIEASSIFIGTISPTATAITRSAFQRVSFDTTAGNNGYEGIAYDSTTNTFWSVKEYGPKKIVRFTRPAGNADVSLTPDVPFDAETLPADDLSAIQFDSRTGNLLILSDLSHKLMEVTPNGVVLSELQMSDKSQHEGVALDSAFDLVITSEPDRYRFYGQ